MPVNPIQPGLPQNFLSLGASSHVFSVYSSPLSSWPPSSLLHISNPILWALVIAQGRGSWQGEKRVPYLLSDGTVLKRCASLTLLEVAGAVLTLPSSLCPFLENVSAGAGGFSVRPATHTCDLGFSPSPIKKETEKRKKKSSKNSEAKKESGSSVSF